jgi:hypothetical protein
VKGPDSWEGRPRDIETIAVSKLSPDLRADFKRLIGKRRWTTSTEVQRLLDLRKIRFKQGDPDGSPS